jgi:histidinol dehydrogenase
MIELMEWSGLDSTQREQALARPPSSTSEELSKGVADIIAAVRRGGDAALADLTARFDGVSPASLRVPADQIEAAADGLAPAERAALERARDNILTFHRAQVGASIEVETSPGVVCGRVTRPIDAVGLYVPAGTAPLPSTTLMLG